MDPPYAREGVCAGAGQGRRGAAARSVVERDGRSQARDSTQQDAAEQAGEHLREKGGGEFLLQQGTVGTRNCAIPPLQQKQIDKARPDRYRGLQGSTARKPRTEP